MKTKRRSAPTMGQRRLTRLIVLACLLAVLVWAWSRHRRPAVSTATEGSSSLVDPKLMRAFVQIETAEKEADRHTWQPELIAQQYGAAINNLWNSLNVSSNALKVLRHAPVDSLAVNRESVVSELPHGILRRTAVLTSPPLPAPEWQTLLDGWITDGWRLDQSEWHHRRFHPGTHGAPATSDYEVILHFSNARLPSRAQITAMVEFSWPPLSREPEGHRLGQVTVHRWELLRRDGPPPFQETAMMEIMPFPKTTWVDPLIVIEPGITGTSELLLAGRNLVLRREGTEWKDITLSPHHPGLAFTALFADFTEDGREDLLLVVRSGLVLLRAGPTGAFDSPAEPAWTAPEQILYGQAFTCGDIDGDGDLDVFLGQYRTPYQGGQMPHPYFDANDGPPSYLLKGTGNGRFADATPGSGLELKRHRRTYAASFVDLDGDGDLDLVVTSDFAGVDIHLNRGDGVFTDHTASWVDEPRAFGMSHAFADFDADGHLDFCLVGMPQNTAERLSALGLERPGFEHWITERSRLSHGNRLYFGTPEGYRQRAVSRQVARAGWAWGIAAADLDDDRFPDLHIVNGHDTKRSVRDYETEFWTHDIYVGDSTPRVAADAYFSSKFARARAEGWSYGGYHKNRLFLNLGGQEFVEVGHLFGLAVEEPCRNVVADDLDGDGDLDLVVTTFETWPRVRQTLRVFESSLARRGQWIAFRFRPGPKSISPFGASITIADARGVQRRVHVTGDSYRTQGSPLVRFGLGEVDRVDHMEVTWPGGRRSRLANLLPNQLYELPCPNQ